MQFLTIFTPTYNRENLLPRLYKSLCGQSNKDFIWLIIDDGSTDGTRRLIESYIHENPPFKIEYHYKENGGLHTGYNEAINHLDTELCVCCDSDDWFPSEAVELINKTWLEFGSDECAGIVGLDCYADGTIIGEALPTDRYFDLNKLYIDGKLIGDKKVVVRSELYKRLPRMESINGEKNFNPNYLNVQISEMYQWISLNENLCFVEYQPEGMTANIYKQYRNSPNSFIRLRILYIGLREATLLFKMRHVVHYDAECMLAGRFKDIFNTSSPDPILSVLLFPVGLLLYILVLLRTK